MRFKLEVELGNAEMNSAYSLAAALIQVGRHFQAHQPSVRQEAEKKILDNNGNTVGQWVLTSE